MAIPQILDAAHAVTFNDEIAKMDGYWQNMQKSIAVNRASAATKHKEAVAKIDEYEDRALELQASDDEYVRNEIERIKDNLVDQRISGTTSDLYKIGVKKDVTDYRKEIDRLYADNKRATRRKEAIPELQKQLSEMDDPDYDNGAIMGEMLADLNRPIRDIVDPRTQEVIVQGGSANPVAKALGGTYRHYKFDKVLQDMKDSWNETNTEDISRKDADGNYISQGVKINRQFTEAGLDESGQPYTTNIPITQKQVRNEYEAHPGLQEHIEKIRVPEIISAIESKLERGEELTEFEKKMYNNKSETSQGMLYMSDIMERNRPGADYTVAKITPKRAPSVAGTYTPLLEKKDDTERNRVISVVDSSYNRLVTGGASRLRAKISKSVKGADPNSVTFEQVGDEYVIKYNIKEEDEDSGKPTITQQVEKVKVGDKFGLISVFHDLGADSPGYDELSKYAAYGLGGGDDDRDFD
jgi:hypothetical protein